MEYGGISLFEDRLMPYKFECRIPNQRCTMKWLMALKCIFIN